MDNEMIDRLTPILLKHNPQTKIGAAIVLVELLQAMRQPTEKMKLAGALIDAGQSGKYSYDEIYQIMIDTITGDE